MPAEVKDILMLRLPAGMRERLRTLAGQHRRTMNAEAIIAIENYFEDVDADREANAGWEDAKPISLRRARLA